MDIAKKRIRNVLRLNDSPYCINFSPDGRLIASGSESGLEIWNWRDGSLKIVEETESYPSAICFSPNGQCIAVGMQSGDVLIWNVRTGQWVEKLMRHCGRVRGVTFMPDGMGLVSGGGDETVKFWDMSFLRLDDSGPEARNCGMKAKGSTGGQEILDFGEHKVCDFYILRTYIYKLTTFSSQSPVHFVAPSSSGDWIVSCSSTEVCVWNARNAELHCELSLPNRSWIFDFSPVGALSEFYGDGRVFLWRIKDVLDL